MLMKDKSLRNLGGVTHLCCKNWLSIKDGFTPRDRQEVLVYTSDGEYRVATYHSDTHSFTMTMECGWDYDGGINYWIPLPSPPREKNVKIEGIDEC